MAVAAGVGGAFGYLGGLAEGAAALAPTAGKVAGTLAGAAGVGAAATAGLAVGIAGGAAYGLSARSSAFGSSARKLPQSKAPAQGQNFFWALLNSRSLASLQPAGSKKLTPSLGSTAKTEASCVAGCRKPKNVFYGRHGERSFFRRRQSPEGWQSRGRRTLLLSAWLSARKVPGRSKNAGGERYCFRRARALESFPRAKPPCKARILFWGCCTATALPVFIQSLGSTAKTVLCPRGLLQAVEFRNGNFERRRLTGSLT